MRRWTLPVGLATLVLAITIPAVVRPDLITAWPGGEADNHLWMHWQAANGPGPWANAPQGTGLPLMDPVNLGMFAFGFLLGPTVAWNLVWVWSVALAAAGGAWLGAEAGGRRGAAIGAAVLACCPALGGMGAFGITELWPIGWLAVFAAAMVRLGRTGRWPWAVTAWAALTGYAFGGWYDVVFAAIVAPPIAVWAGWGRPWRRWLATSAAIGAGAALVVLPRFVSFLGQRALWAHRWGDAPDPSFTGWWPGPTGGGADLLHYVVPVPVDAPSGVTAYLGWVVLALAVLGVRRRRDMVLVAGAGVALALGLGPTVRLAGLSTGIPGPSALATAWLPGLEGLTHWYRVAVPVAVLLAPLAAVGVGRLRWRWAVPALVVAIAVESRALSPVPWPAEQYDPRPPAALAALPGWGGLVLLPFDNGRVEYSVVQAAPRMYDRWGPWLERPLSENYEGPDALLQTNRLIAAADRACGVEPRIPVRWRARDAFSDPERLDEAALLGATRGLQQGDFEWVVLLPDRAATPAASRAVLERWLGPPEVDGDEVVAWRVP